MNMNRRKKVTGALAMMLLLLLLAACGARETTDESVEAADTAPPVENNGPGQTAVNSAADAAEGPVVIDSGGEVPFYARFGEDETFDDGTWTVIVFYRPPDCIPADFNLNRFFHFPDETGPGAFGCAPATMTGVETWQNGPEVDPAPLEAEMTGRGAVPVWFVKGAELEEVMADGLTTIDEVASLPSRLVGTAATYNEFLRPTQSNEAPMIRFTAVGTLEDGVPFHVDVSKGAADVVDHVTIEMTETQ